MTWAINAPVCMICLFSSDAWIHKSRRLSGRNGWPIYKAEDSPHPTSAVLSHIPIMNMDEIGMRLMREVGPWREREVSCYYGSAAITQTCCVHRGRCHKVIMPFQSMYLRSGQRSWRKGGVLVLPLLMTFFSTHQSPSTVKRNARVLTIGTVRLNSLIYINKQYSQPPANAYKASRTYQLVRSARRTRHYRSS